MAIVRTYNVTNGRAKIQIEDLLGTKPGGGWVYQGPGRGNNPGAEGAHYYYKSQTAQGSHKTVPDAGRFTFKVTVPEKAIYSILLRASRDSANPGDARNDVWIKVDGGTQGMIPGNQRLTTSEGFAKFKSAPAAHKWVDAKTFSTPTHGDDNAPSDVVLNKGTHTITFAPRSTGYHIDSVQIVKKGLSTRAEDLDSTPVAVAEPENDNGLDKGSDKGTDKPGVDDGTEKGVIEVAIAAAGDDFESKKAAASRDLEFGQDGQSVGLRFKGIELDKEADIKAAYFVFEAAETSTGAASYAIEVQDTTGAKTYTKASGPDARAYLDADVDWNPGAWTKGETYKSADISELIEAVIEEGGLDALDSLAFRISGAGERVAEAFEGKGQAPELVIELA
jgi:hypothetical protein